MKTLGLIPSRLASTRLKNKPLLKIKDMPIVIHTYKRALMSKKLDDLFICCDDIKIKKICEHYGAKSILTSKKHTNGTERIGEGYKKLKKKYDLIVDIQGDEPLINPSHIDQVIDFHSKNKNTDIILPTLKSNNYAGKHVVNVLKTEKNDVIYLSRGNLPFQFKTKNSLYYKHLSIISFTPSSLKKFCESKQTFLEKIEGIELLRAIELNMKIKTLLLKGDSFSVDVKKDFIKAKKFILKDNISKKYLKNE